MAFSVHVLIGIAPSYIYKPFFFLLFRANSTAKMNYGMVHVCLFSLNLFKPNGISHSYQLDQLISVLKVVGWYAFFILFKF